MELAQLCSIILVSVDAMTCKKEPSLKVCTLPNLWTLMPAGVMVVSWWCDTGSGVCCATDVPTLGHICVTGGHRGGNTSLLLECILMGAWCDQSWRGELLQWSNSAGTIYPSTADGGDHIAIDAMTLGHICVTGGHRGSSVTLLFGCDVNSVRCDWSLNVK